MDRSIAVAGAGSIGCFVGGVLAANAFDVALLARSRVADAIIAHGLRVTSLDGFDRTLDANAFRVASEPEMLAAASIVLVTVKSTDTAAMAQTIAAHAPADAVIVSLQNGVGNVPLLRRLLPGRKVIAGMVPFNVLAIDERHVHRATSGEIILEDDPEHIAAFLSTADLRMRPSGDIERVQWGKLLLNLNNTLNALSDLPLRDQLSHRAWRSLLADQIAEAQAVVEAAGIRPISATPLPAALMPLVLRLPDALFKGIAGRMLKIDPTARSSMWQDLQRRRPTEIDHLQGAIIALAREHARPAPLSARVARLIREAETHDRGAPGLTPAQVRG